MIKANAVMTPRPAMVGGNDRLSDAVQVLQALEVRHLPVVNEQRELIGMLSDRDLGALTLPVLVNDEWLGTVQTALGAPVSSIMTGDPISVDLDADLAEVVDLMLDNRIGALPVIDAERRLVGIISYVDVLRKLCLE